MNDFRLLQVWADDGSLFGVLNAGNEERKEQVEASVELGTKAEEGEEWQVNHYHNKAQEVEKAAHELRLLHEEHYCVFEAYHIHYATDKR